jgi:hypothetical protein
VIYFDTTPFAAPEKAPLLALAGVIAPEPAPEKDKF